MKEYNKLVRDKIPEIITKNGQEAITRRLTTDDEFKAALDRKLVEEVNGFLESHDKVEIADILEVIDAICRTNGWPFSEIYNIKAEKVSRNGSFNKRIMLVAVADPEEERSKDLPSTVSEQLRSFMEDMKRDYPKNVPPDNLVRIVKRFMEIYFNRTSDSLDSSLFNVRTLNEKCVEQQIPYQIKLVRTSDYSIPSGMIEFR